MGGVLTCRLLRRQQIAQQFPKLSILGPLRSCFFKLGDHLGALQGRFGIHPAEHLYHQERQCQWMHRERCNLVACLLCAGHTCSASIHCGASISRFSNIDTALMGSPTNTLICANPSFGSGSLGSSWAACSK